MTHILLDIALYVTNSISVIRHNRIADLSEHYFMSWTYVQRTFSMLNDFRYNMYKVKSEWAYGYWLCLFVCLLVLLLWPVDILSLMKRMNCFFNCLFMIRNGVSHAKFIQLFYLTLFPCMLKWEWLLIFHVHYIFVFWMGVNGMYMCLWMCNMRWQSSNFCSACRSFIRSAWVDSFSGRLHGQLWDDW